MSTRPPTARSRSSAWREKKYGLIISDWNMEPMTGYDLLKEVRSNPEFKSTPFIMVTAESKTENVIAAKKAGVNNYIVKPFNAQTLKTKIDAVFTDAAKDERAATRLLPDQRAGHRTRLDPGLRKNPRQPLRRPGRPGRRALPRECRR